MALRTEIKFVLSSRAISASIGDKYGILATILCS